MITISIGNNGRRLRCIMQQRLTCLLIVQLFIPQEYRCRQSSQQDAPTLPMQSTAYPSTYDHNSQASHTGPVQYQAISTYWPCPVSAIQPQHASTAGIPGEAHGHHSKWITR